MRYIFMGTPRFAEIILAALIDAGRPPVGVMTQIDQPAGRGQVLTPPPVKVLAEQHGIPIRQPAKIGEPTREWMRSLTPDICVVAAYGKILTRETLDVAPFGCINAHASLLPKYRGAAPVAWAIINGEKETGITIMHVSEGQDEGDIIYRQAMAIGPEDTCATLSEKLAAMAGSLLIKAMDELEAGTAPRIPQSDLDEEPTYAPKLNKDDGLIDWNRSAEKIANLVRGTSPWPGAYTGVECRMLKVLEAEVVPVCGGAPGEVLSIEKDGLVVATGENALRLITVQMEGKRALPSFDCAQGLRLKPGQKLSDD